MKKSKSVNTKYGKTALMKKQTQLKIWETSRPWKNQKQRRINFALDNFSYIVVIAEIRKGFDPVTAYHIIPEKCLAEKSSERNLNHLF